MGKEIKSLNECKRKIADMIIAARCRKDPGKAVKEDLDGRELLLSAYINNNGYDPRGEVSISGCVITALKGSPNRGYAFIRGILPTGNFEVQLLDYSFKRLGLRHIDMSTDIWAQMTWEAKK